MGADNLFGAYVERFVPTRSPYYEKRKMGWRPVYRYPGKTPKLLTDRDVRDHVDGTRKYPVGVPIRGELDFMMFDIDDHDGKGLKEVNRVMDGIRETFDNDGIAFTTATGEGRQLIIPTDRRVCHDLLASHGTQLLTANGLSPSSGRLENRIGSHNTRLPHGPGSVLVDPTGRPVSDRSVSRGALEALLVAWDELPKFVLPDMHRVEAGLVVPTVHVSQRAAFYWKNGLQEPGTRNEVVPLLIGNCLSGGDSRDDAYARVWAWLKQHNNGISNGYARSPEECRLNIRWWAENYDFSKRPFVPAETHRPALTAFYDSIKGLGVREKAFLVEVALLACIRGIKEDGSVKVPIPWKTLRSYDPNYSIRLQTLRTKGILTIHEEYVRPFRSVEGHCRTYRLLPFPTNLTTDTPTTPLPQRNLLKIGDLPK